MHLDLCDDLVRRAVARGAADAEVFYRKVRKLEAMFEKNDLQVPKGDTYEGVGIRVLLGGSNGAKLGFAATNHLTSESLENALSAAIAIAQASPEDPNHSLPDPAPAETVPGIYDESAEELTLRDAIDQGRLMLEAARGADPRVTLDSAMYTIEVSEKAIVSSRGVRLSEKRSLFVCQAMAFARDGETVSSFDMEVGASSRMSGMDPAALGRRLGEKVVTTLGATTIPSFRGAVIVAPYAGMDLIVSPITFSSDAENVQTGRSKWKGMIGSQVLSPLLSVIDDPSIPGGASSTAFDREGVPARRLELVKDGVLNHYLYNCYTARKDGVASNGRAAGSDQNTPSIGPTNFVIAPGELSLDDMIAACSKGLIVNRFSGNLDEVSGDFSGVVKGGYYVEAGRIVCPVREAMVAGNIYDLLRQVTDVSRECVEIADIRLPYVQFDGCSVTGKQ